MPLIITLPPHCLRISFTSSQDNDASNWLTVQSANDDMSFTPLTWPTILPNCRRFVPNMPRHQAGFCIRLIILRKVGFGGALNPFLTSLWRCPMICRSSVIIKAAQFAARARSTNRLIKSRSRITYSWNQNGASLLAATSSIEQIDMVDRVNGTPKSAAALAARISPSACCMPVKPVGASATGIVTVSPSISIAVSRWLTSIATRWRNFIACRSSSLAW